MKIESGTQVRFDSVTIEVSTTAGSLFVHIMSDMEGNPCGIQLNIGKNGGELYAMSQGLARICSLAMDHGATITELLAELSNHSTDKIVRKPNGVQIDSVLGGLCYALMEYQRDRYEGTIRLLDTSPRLGG